MARNEGKKAVLVSAKHHEMLRYISESARPRVTLLAQAEALIEEAYNRLRKRQRAVE